MFYPTPLIRYADPAFSQDRTTHCQLRLQVSDQELALSVFDPLPAAFPLIERYTIQKGYSGLKSQEALARILQTHPLTRLPFKTVECIIVTAATTLVPGILFDGAQAGNYIGLSHELSAEQVVSWDRFDQQDMYLIYAWPLAWKQLLDTLFSNYTLHHYGFHLLRELLVQPLPEPVVYVHVQDFRADIVVIRNGKLDFYNSFTFQSTEDFIYYVLLVYDRYSLNRELVPLRLLGEVERGSSIYNSCYKYVRDVDFTKRSSIHVVPDPAEEMDALPDHFFFNLLHSSHEDNKR